MKPRDYSLVSGVPFHSFQQSILNNQMFLIGLEK